LQSRGGTVFGSNARQYLRRPERKSLRANGPEPGSG